MPAYSFKERFIPMLKDGSKKQTIRARRKGKQQNAVPGQKVYLYYGMRTKYCTKIGEGICINKSLIEIHEDGSVFLNHNKPGLSDELKDLLAWNDGFRPEGATRKNPKGCFELMFRWWWQTHELPFRGEIIYWQLYEAE
jgi:hypothetical protein